jgi:hypothetical protein
MRVRHHAMLVGLLVSGTATASAQVSDTLRPANRPAFLDRDGVLRWRDDRREVALFGSNYVIHTASDYRAAGYVYGDRKQMIDQDVAQFARMGWNGLRLTFWGDWESADSVGNLIANDHLDLLDYLIARARERGIYMLFSPIQLYNAKWPDALQDTTAPGFGRHFDRSEMGTNPAAIAAQANYIRQMLDHVNPYTGVALKHEPAILFMELVNEPVHHPEDLPGSVRYINTLTDAARSAGFRKPILYNVSQDFRIGEAIRRSKVDGVTFGWYPTGLNSGRELRGNFLRGTDAFPDMLRPELDGMPRMVYEFDSPDTRDGLMYPAMARTYRSVGGQAALMFAYDMLGTASRNLGWQTHYLNLVYTPRKAVGSILAAEAMYRLPARQSYGTYPANTRFGDFRLSYPDTLAELVASDAFMYSGSTTSRPTNLATLRRIVGFGSSPVVQYGGAGVYFLDQIREGLWRLEVYPDAVPVRDPFELPRLDKIVTRAISRDWSMTVSLPDLGADFAVQPIASGNPASTRAAAGNFTVRPGVYLLSASGNVDVASLPRFVSGVGLTEYHAPPADTVALVVQPLSDPVLLAGREGTLRARVVDVAAPDSVVAYVRPTAGGFFRGYRMRHDRDYEFVASIPAADLMAGPHEYVISAWRDGRPTTFPDGRSQAPWDWNYVGTSAWPLGVVEEGTPLVLFEPASDANMLAFSRVGDAGRRGLFRVGYSPATGLPSFHLELPSHSNGEPLADYTASLVLLDRVVPRRETIHTASALRVRARGIGPRQTLHLTLMEDDGTSWTTGLPLDTAWVERNIPLAGLTAGRGVLLPQGFPGTWNYWVTPAAGRGGATDRFRPAHLERLQLSLRREDGVAAGPGQYGVEVESVVMHFGGAPR